MNSEQNPSTAFDPKMIAALAGLHLKARYVMEGLLSGLHQSPFHGFSVEFSDYRDYQPGDDLKHVDWRLYARNDRLCIKRYEQETNVRFYMLIDASASMAYRGETAWASKLECAVILATALTWLMLRQNDAVGLLSMRPEVAKGPLAEVASERRVAPMLHPSFVAPSQKPSQFGLLLRHLQALQPAGADCLDALLTHATRLVHRRSVVVLFSDLLEQSDSLQMLFKQLRFLGHECIVFQVLDRDETDFPFTGRRVFRDLESGVRRQVRGEDIRVGYLERFHKFMETHRQVFRTLEMTHTVVRTDENPGHALAAFLAKRRRLQ